MAQPTGSLTPKGTGRPDYRTRIAGTVKVDVRTGSVNIAGTIEHLLTIGTVKTVRYMGSVGRVLNVGSVGRLGTVRYLQSGSLGAVSRVGTVKSLGSIAQLARAGTVQDVIRLGTVKRVLNIGSVGRLGTVRYLQAGSLGKISRVGSITRMESLGTLSSRQATGTVFSDRVHTAVGSVVVSPWVDVYRFVTKSFAVKNTLGGSVHIISGFRGTGVGGGTGTYYSQRIGGGTYTMLSLTESIQFLRAITRSGSVGSGKGSLSVMLNTQV